MIRPLLFSALLAVTVFQASTAKADLIVGSIGFNVDGNISPPTGDLDQAFQLTNVVTNNLADGDWDNVVFKNGLFVSSMLEFGAFNSLGNAFSFSDPNFGTFSGNVDLDTGETGSGTLAQRVLVVTGLFQPGATLSAQGFNETTAGQLQVILLNIAGGGRSSSIVFGTAVPEPTSCLLLGLSLLGVASARRSYRSRRRSNFQGVAPSAESGTLTDV